jgi:nitrogen-specific signal transduction histidine kinase
MDSRALLALGAAVVTGAMAYGVIRRPRRSDLDALLLTLLASLALWCVMGSSAFAFNGSLSRHVAVQVGIITSLAAVPLWLIFTLRASRSPVLARFPGLPMLLFAPAPLGCVAVLTNSVHHGMLRAGATGYESFREMAGPLMLLFSGYVLVCMAGAACALLGWAWRLRESADIHRAALAALALAGLLPVATIVARMLGPAPPAPALIPSSLVVSLLLLAAGPLRDRVLQGVPITHREVFDALRDGVLVGNARGTVVDANAAAERLLGRPRAALCGRELASVIAELAAVEGSTALRRELEDLTAVDTPVRLDVALRDGRRLEVRAACVGEPGFESIGRYALLRDRTEERRFAEVARRAQKLETVATLAGGVAHEVSNPLSFVRADLNEIQRLAEAVEAHRKGGPSPLADELADLRGLAEEALEGIARIERIAAGMRRLATAGEGFGAVDLIPVLDEAVQLARIRFTRPLAVELQLDPQLPAVRGAPALLVQALVHLLVAAQRGPAAAGGTIRVRGERSDGTVLLRIGGAGGTEAGVAAAVGAPDGDDLGVPIARDIARDHGGELEVVGPPGAPTALTLRLPLVEVA